MWVTKEAVWNIYGDSLHCFLSLCICPYANWKRVFKAKFHCTSCLKRNNVDTLLLADSVTTMSQNNNSSYLELSCHISKTNKNYFFFLQIFPWLKHVQKIHCFLPYCRERQNFHIEVSVWVSFARLCYVLIASSQMTLT